MSGSRSRSGKNRGRSQKKGGRKGKRFDAAAFWGDPDTEIEPPTYPTGSADPAAAVTSLGHPPLPGQGAASQQYFKAVYERASMLATALAHAGRLDEIGATPSETDTPAGPADGELGAEGAGNSADADASA